MLSNATLLLLTILSGCVVLDDLKPNYWQDDMGNCHAASKSGGVQFYINCDDVPESKLKFKRK